MIAALLFVILVSGDGKQEVQVDPKSFKSIVSCTKEAKATVKAMAGQSDWKIKSIQCKPLVMSPPVAVK